MAISDETRNRYCYFLRVAIGVDGVFVCKKVLKHQNLLLKENVVLVELDYLEEHHKL
jgi:hypothetical protein